MTEIICSGVGGQGILTLGLLIAEVAAEHDKYVTWVPAYGSEMRGGFVSCTMKIAETPIVSPYIEKPNLLVAMSQEAFNNYKDQVKNGGCIIVNSTTIKEATAPEGINLLPIAAGDIAAQENNLKGVGVAIVGAVLAYTKFVSKEAGAKSVGTYFAKKNIKSQGNKAVYLAGYDAARCYIEGGSHGS